MKSPIVHLIIVCLFCSVSTLTAQSETQEPAYYIKSIFFGGGSYQIDEGQVEELQEFLDQFDPIDEYEILIQSHTDNIGSVEYNNWLSSRRGEMTKFYIIDHGIPVELLSNEDFGEYTPDFDNDTWKGRQANRRVDVIIRRIVF
ncbi:MAG: OmpA family protein [Bacteroidota bacterium]